MGIVDSPRLVVGGVDTHLDTHVAAVVDHNGGVLGIETFPVNAAGYAALSSWMADFGALERVGIEGTGAYGIGLARHFGELDVPVVEIDRPNRQQRRRQGKSDQLDAVEAARGALSGRCSGVAKSSDGQIEALRALMVVKRSARANRIRTVVQLRYLMFTAPDELRQRFAGATPARMVKEAARLRPSGDPVMHATKTAAIALSRRVQALDAEIAAVDEQIEPIVKASGPRLLDIYGCGTDTAAILLVAAGDNADRIRSEAAWAMLCGVAPIPANSGKRDGRYRLNSGGNRQANHAHWRIVLTRLGQRDERTVAYMNRRLEEGLAKPEIIRCLKRYVARETFNALPR
ncbi:MAG: transposase [Actinobacteria bacterium]|uniref:Unannotated protein n=1 Tax=freshwater metagenome TaxID=449393 RepID=A0A6J6EFC5_9ZZZZ|nr:transposase [Actinomycetota bacterium]